MRPRCPLALVLALATGLQGCPDDDDATGEIALTLVSPTDGEVVCGDPLEVVTVVENFTLVNETIEDPPPDTGHLHVYLNGQEYAQSDSPEVVVTGVTDGEYQLRVDLARADHQALDPYVGTTIYITVDNSLCSR
jgi:hypothetical protein